MRARVVYCARSLLLICALQTNSSEVVLLLLASLTQSCAKGAAIKVHPTSKAFVFTSINVVVSTRKRTVRHYDYETAADKGLPAIVDATSEMALTWQLFNHCSLGFMQNFMKTFNTRGRQQDACTTTFLVHVHNDGSLRLEHAATGKSVCFNRRRRLTVKENAADVKCHFVEHLTEEGYTMLESAWAPGLFLGFNKKGRFQDPSRFTEKKRCFLYSKLESVTPTSKLRSCRRPNNFPHLDSTTQLPSAVDIYDTEKLLYDLARENLLNRIEI
ncbi:Fibroblast growth factor family protein [Aphelenchoides avenae]|nr:Fibroblast growth factor family protein [Aphelenchus avenae]